MMFDFYLFINKNSAVSIEEFHSKLQELTNFPLRPFVIPFLKSNLPLLQYELIYLSRVVKLTSNDYLIQNSENIFSNGNYITFIYC